VGQNCASKPFGGFAKKAMVAYDEAYMPDDPCDEYYVAKEHRHSMVKAQYEAVEKGPCWQCKCPDPRGWKVAPRKKPPPPVKGVLPKGKTKKKFTPDHQPPSFLLWYSGGCNKGESAPDSFKKQFQDKKNVQPHCKQCSDKQGGFSAISRQLKVVHGH
jgi:hypothetical protein